MIIHFLITVLVIYGIKASTDEGMIFEGVYIFVVKQLARVTDERVIAKIMKPLFDCTPCMASVYGTISFFAYGDMALIYWPVWVFALSGFNYLVNKIIK